jgi:hypothetical protein
MTPVALFSAFWMTASKNGFRRAFVVGGPGHSYCVNFGLSDFWLQKAKYDPSECLTYLGHNPKTVMPLIDPNWSSVTVPSSVKLVVTKFLRMYPMADHEVITIGKTIIGLQWISGTHEFVICIDERWIPCKSIDKFLGLARIFDPDMSFDFLWKDVTVQMPNLRFNDLTLFPEIVHPNWRCMYECFWRAGRPEFGDTDQNAVRVRFLARATDALSREIPNGLIGALLDDAANTKPELATTGFDDRHSAALRLLQEYVTRHTASFSIWGGRVDVTLAAMEYQRPIYVFGRNGTPMFAYNAQGEDIDIRAGAIPDEAILLFNCGKLGTHYNLLVRRRP